MDYTLLVVFTALAGLVFHAALPATMGLSATRFGKNFFGSR